MSLFLNQGSLTAQDVDEEKLRLAELHYTAMKATLDTMTKGCQVKCIPPEYSENDVNKGEATCIDRCVKKFMEANRIVGTYTQSVRFDATSLGHYQEIKRDYLQGEQQQQLQRNSRR